MNYMSPWIFTTTRCNLKCPYCYVKQDGNDMEENTYKRINDVFLSMIESGEKDYVIYRMAGGEPLLTFDKWFPFTEDFIRKSGGKGYVSVITNLTILSDDMLEKFSKSNYSFGVSLDGFSYSKPSHAGSSSAEIVKENIDRLISAGIKNIDISTVIGADSFKDVELLAEWIAERNLNWGIYLDHFFCGEIDLNMIVSKMIKVIDILCEHNYNIHDKFKFSNISISSQYEGCTAGEKLITIFWNGDIFPCQTTVYEQAVCNIFGGVNITEEFKKQKKYRLGYNYELPPKCKNCPISDMCGGGCKQNYKEANRDYVCDILKPVIYYMIKKWRVKNAEL